MSVSGLFTGNSTYSNDFAQLINRAVQIASLPITQLSSQKDTLSGEKTALSNLSTSFSSLQSALTALDTAADTSRYAVSYTDSTVAIASASSGAMSGTYSVEVVNAGTQARASSAGTVADPAKSSISAASAFTLTVNGKLYENIKPAANTLNGLADAINTAVKGDVQATVVNVGTNIAPSYQLSIRDTKYGSATITLTGDGGANLLDMPSAATPVQYRLNGQPSGAPLESDTRTLTIGPNLSVTVLKAGSTDITVGQNVSAITNALTTFVGAYNSVTSSIDSNRGSSKGALTGQSLLITLSQSMQQVSGYSGSGTIRSISGLGLKFDKNGVLSLDTSVLTAAASSDFRSVTDFLGSVEGGGFLKAASAALNSITNSSSGVLTAASASIDTQITNTDTLINDNQERVDQMKAGLNAQMAAADALIASLQQQVTYLTNMFSAMQSDSKSITG